MEVFNREKAFHAGEKIRKNDFAPSEKFSCYTRSEALGAETISGFKSILRGILGTKLSNISKPQCLPSLSPLEVT